MGSNDRARKSFEDLCVSVCLAHRDFTPASAQEPTSSSYCSSIGRSKTGLQTNCHLTLLYRGSIALLGSLVPMIFHITSTTKPHVVLKNCPL